MTLLKALIGGICCPVLMICALLNNQIDYAILFGVVALLLKEN